MHDVKEGLTVRTVLPVPVALTVVVRELTTENVGETVVVLLTDVDDERVVLAVTLDVDVLEPVKPTLRLALDDPDIDTLVDELRDVEILLVPLMDTEVLLETLEDRDSVAVVENVRIVDPVAVEDRVCESVDVGLCVCVAEELSVGVVVVLVLPELLRLLEVEPEYDDDEDNVERAVRVAEIVPLTVAVADAHCVMLAETVGEMVLKALTVGRCPVPVTVTVVVEELVPLGLPV